MKKLAIQFLKWGVSLALIGYLLFDASQQESFRDLAIQGQDWPELVLALMLVFTAVMLTIIRWYVLVRAIRLKFTWKDAVRLGFWSYLLNFISLGAVGGDVFKAIFVAREQPDRKADAISTVVVDRAIGLYALFFVASVAILATGLMNNEPSPMLKATIHGTFAITLGGAIAGGLLLIPGMTTSGLAVWFTGVKGIGPMVKWLLQIIEAYRRRPIYLAIAFALSLAVHISMSAGIYWTAQGLIDNNGPTLSTHLVVVPLAMASGVLPLPLNGLGGFEYLLDFLYQEVSRDVPMTTTRSLLVALGYRIQTIVVALIGLVVYRMNQKELQAVMHQAHEEAEAVTSA